MKEEKGLISLIVLSWNHENYIKQCMESLISQTYKDIEIIYIDNSSSDQTFEIGTNVLTQSNRRYKTKQFDYNIGAAKAVNYALTEMCTGEFIGITSSDDWLSIDNYKKKMDFYLDDQECKVIYSDGYAYYDDENKEVVSKSFKCKGGYIFKDLLKVNFLFTQGSLIKREVYETIGLYNENCSVEDWDFSLKASKIFKVGYIDEPLFYWRKHPQSYSTLKPQKFYEDILLILKQYKNYPEHKIGVKWAAFDYIKENMWPLSKKKSWQFIINYYYLIIPILKCNARGNPTFRAIWKIFASSKN